MRLLVVSTSFPKKPGDSLSPFMWDYCRYLKKLGWDITVLVPHHKDLEIEEMWDDIRIVRFKYLPKSSEDLAYSGGLLPGLKSSPLKGLKIPFFIRSMYKETLNIISGGKIDIVNFHWLFPACFWLRGLLRKTDIPVVLTGHGTDVHLALKKPFRYFANKALRKSSAVTVNSGYMKNMLGDLKTPDRVEVIPMGVDTEKFSPGKVRPIDSARILYIGRLIEQKGVGLLLEAFREVVKSIPGAILEIVGYGPEKERLSRRADEIGLQDNVVFVDPVEYTSLPEKYRSARALMLPSLVPEGLGMTAIEAGGCEVPTVTFGLGGTSEFVINEKTGLIVKPGSSSLAEGMIRLLTDDDLAARLGKSAREAVIEKYAWPVVSAKFDILFKSLL